MYTAIHASCSSRSRTVQGESTNSRPRRRVSHDITYAKCFCKCPGMSSYRIIGLKVPWNEQLQKRGGGRVALIIQAAGERTAGGAWLSRSWGKVGFDKDFVRDTEIAG